MPLTDNEISVIKTCCDLNENVSLNIRENNQVQVYKSRFLAVDFDKGFLVIDEPSPETPDAKTLSRGQSFEIYFEYSQFRYLFNSTVLELTKFKLPDRALHALKILLPKNLVDGDKREYFRVEIATQPPVSVEFNIFPKAGTSPIMSSLIENTPEDFSGDMIEISGNGFAMRTKPGEEPLPLEKGDAIDARFKLREGYEWMDLWSEVRSSRRYKDTRIFLWGLQFLGKDRNPLINHYRNKILRYVTERQREILVSK